MALAPTTIPCPCGHPLVADALGPWPCPRCPRVWRLAPCSACGEAVVVDNEWRSWRCPGCDGPNLAAWPRYEAPPSCPHCGAWGLVTSRRSAAPVAGGPGSPGDVASGGGAVLAPATVVTELQCLSCDAHWRA